MIRAAKKTKRNSYELLYQSYIEKNPYERIFYCTHPMCNRKEFNSVEACRVHVKKRHQLTE
jgi:hypothetical protein